MMLFFNRPEYLIFLFVIPLFIFIHFISINLVKKKAIKFANFEAISRVSGAELFSKNLTMLYFNIAIISLVVLALSGASVARQVEASEMSFVIAIDASRSMSVDDILPTRLEAAKKTAIDFLSMIPEGTRVGIVSFSGFSYIEQEVSGDKTLVKRAINNIEMQEVGGTDIFNALITSANLLKNEDSKVIILISDGSLNLNSIQDVVDYSNKYGFIVHSLLVGTQEGSVDEFGALFRISEDTMKAISDSTGGNYYTISEVQDFYSSFNDISRLNTKTAIVNLSTYLTIFAIVLFLLEFFLINTRYRTLP